MATNPRIPPVESRGPQLVSTPPVRPPSRARRRIPLVMLCIAVAALVLGSVLYSRPRSPKPAPVSHAAMLIPVPADNSDIELSGVQLGNPGTAGIALTLEGQIANHGTTPLTGAVVQVGFRDEGGNSLAVSQRPIQGIASGNCEVSSEFVSHPIKPNDIRLFCVAVQAPEGWNHQLPELKVAAIMVQ